MFQKLINIFLRPNKNKDDIKESYCDSDQEYQLHEIDETDETDYETEILRENLNKPKKLEHEIDSHDTHDIDIAKHIDNDARFFEPLYAYTASEILDKIITRATSLKVMTSHMDNENSNLTKEWLNHVLNELEGKKESKSSTNKGYVQTIESYNRELERGIHKTAEKYKTNEDIFKKTVDENKIAKIAVAVNHSASEALYEAMHSVLLQDKRYDDIIFEDDTKRLPIVIKDSNISIRLLALMSDYEILAIYGIGPAYLVKIKNTFIASGLFAVCTLDLSIIYNKKSFSDKLEGIYSTFKKESYTWLAPSFYYGKNKAIIGFNEREHKPEIVSTISIDELSKISEYDELDELDELGDTLN
jgi:hypothetical protein